MAHKHPHIDIDKLAHKHLARHPDDKSMQHLAKMRRSFKPYAVTRALKRAIETYGLIFPELMAILKAHEAGDKHPKHGNINIDRVMFTEPFYQAGFDKSSQYSPVRSTVADRVWLDEWH